MQKNNKKKTYIIFSIPAHGHTNPQIVIANELVKRGHTVYFYSTKEFKKLIVLSGAIFIEYPYVIPIDLRMSKYGVFLAKRLIEISDEFINKISIPENIDCIIHDAIAPWGKVIAKIHNIPAISISTTLILTKKLIFSYFSFDKVIIFDFLKNGISAYKSYRGFLKKYNLAYEGFDEIFLNKEKINIVLTAKEFQPDTSNFDSSFFFVGPQISSMIDRNTVSRQADNSKNCIYISLGTIYNDDLNFFKASIEAFIHTKLHIFLAIGNNIDLKNLPNIPGNFTIRPHLPQLEILKKAKLFITHAGMNSTMEGLYFGVPLILVPQMTEQYINARRVEELGAGILIDKRRVTSDRLRQAVEHILTSPSYFNSAQELKRKLRAAGGYKTAVDIIENQPFTK